MPRSRQRGRAAAGRLGLYAQRRRGRRHRLRAGPGPRRPAAPHVRRGAAQMLPGQGLCPLRNHQGGGQGSLCGELEGNARAAHRQGRRSAARPAGTRPMSRLVLSRPALYLAAAALLLAAAMPLAPTPAGAAEMLKVVPAALDGKTAYLLLRLGKRDEKLWNMVSFYR